MDARELAKVGRYAQRAAEIVADSAEDGSIERVREWLAVVAAVNVSGRRADAMARLESQLRYGRQ